MLSNLTANTSVSILEFRPESNVADLESYGINIQNMMLPSTWAVMDDEPPRLFSYTRSRGFLERWLSDAQNNVWELLTPLSVLGDISKFESRFPVFVEILSEERPIIDVLPLLSQVGFGWFPQPPLESTDGSLHRYGNNTIVRNSGGQVFHNSNKSIASLWRQLLPGIIPEDSFSLEFVQEISSVFTTAEVHIEINGTLPVWWLGQLEEHPTTMFVHRRQLSSTPKTWTFRRGMEFVTDTVMDRQWLPSVIAGHVAPLNRSSYLPKDRRTGVHEVSSNMLFAWLAANPDSHLYFYNLDDQGCQNTFADTSEPVARMIVPENDHEIFTERPLSGHAIRFVSGIPEPAISCSKVHLNHREL